MTKEEDIKKISHANESELYPIIQERNYLTEEKMLNFDGVVPTLIRRECGGWLALSSKECELKIGVIGKTEAEARSKFGDSFAGWIETLIEFTPRYLSLDLVAPTKSSGSMPGARNAPDA